MAHMHAARTDHGARHVQTLAYEHSDLTRTSCVCYLALQHLHGDVQVLAEVQEVAEGVMGARVDPGLPLMNAGLDSLAAVELRSALSAHFGTDLPATFAFDYPSLQVCGLHGPGLICV